MSKKTSYLVGIFLTIILGTILYWFFCCKPSGQAQNDILVNTSETNEILIEKNPTKTTLNGLKIKDLEGDLDININENLNFNFSSTTIIIPISANVDSSALNLGNYFKSNPSKILHIYGHYQSDETNNSVFPNLGLARANETKNYLVSKGMLSKSINTFGKLDDDLLVNSDSIMRGPLTFKIKTLEDGDTSDAEEIKKIMETIQADPLIIFFETAQTSINLSDAQREKISSLVRYLDLVEEGYIKTIGHTDNTGKRITNIKLGQIRANFAKEYLAKNGIPADKINSSSKGPDSPIADNSTEEGRSKNRRVVVTIN